MYRVLGRIRRFQREHGSAQAKSRWAYAKRLNIELGRKIAGAVTKYAKENHADIIVFEYLETKGKISGKKKQKLHLWRKRDIQKRCEHQAHRNRMRISRICAWNTSRLAYDGTGTVIRDPGNHSLCVFQTGTYDKNREFILTTSPSMDILVSSNLERLLYLSCGRDAAKTKELMEQLSKNGKYEITPEMKEFMKDFSAGYADMEENAKEIKKVFDDTGYLIDTHTGVAAAVYEQYKKKTGDMTKTVIASTASPYKFSRSVMEAVLGKKEDADEFALIDEMERISGVKIPQAIEEIRDAKILHNRQCKPEEMEETVKQTFSK